MTRLTHDNAKRMVGVSAKALEQAEILYGRKGNDLVIDDVDRAEALKVLPGWRVAGCDAAMELPKVVVTSDGPVEVE